MSEENSDYADGYRQAVLDCARCLCLCDHLGDARRNIAFVWKAAGLSGEDGPPRFENTGEVDYDRLEAMGARPPYEAQPLEHARELRFIALVGASCDYRGEIGVLLVNLGSEPFVVQHGDRIAQLVIAPVAMVEPVEVEELEPTERGADGFGSTG